MDRVSEVCNQVKRKVSPSPKLKRAVLAAAEDIRVAVERESNKAGLTAEVRLDGSVAKDTWVRGYEEADIFMRVPTELTKEQLKQICLPVAKRALRPNKPIERFAEHPYVESVVKYSAGNLRVNIVPCYNVQKGDWHSATDRTPFHTEYVLQHLSPEQHDEVRLLKAFLRGIGAYGADIKTGGFSGMMCETLIISHGSFGNVLKDFVEWDEDRYIDVEKNYEGRTNEIRKIFRESLVVIDPVDKGRNLGAAVRPSQLWNFVAASRRFQERPAVSFFFEPRVKPLRNSEFRRQMTARRSSILGVSIGRIDVVVDILWSQLYKTQRALVNLLELNDFPVMQSATWSDEHALSVLLFELESSSVPSPKKHFGPPLSRREESASFLSKHARKDGTVAGPWIERDRWAIMKRRALTSSKELLRATIQSGGTGVGVAPLIIRAFKKDAKVYEGDELLRLMSANRDFASFMRTFLAGRPAWFA